MGGIHFIASKPWVSYVDVLNKMAFVRLFERYNKTLTYEYGANAEVYNSGLETGYLETEIKTPIYTLKPNESFDYYEIQGAAKIATTPILDVNKTGVITQKLSFNETAKELSGSYGVFLEGEAVLFFKNKSGKITKEINLGKVNPLAAFNFVQLIKNQLTSATISLCVKDNTNKTHLLDTYIINLN